MKQQQGHHGEKPPKIKKSKSPPLASTSISPSGLPASPPVTSSSHRDSPYKTSHHSLTGVGTSTPATPPYNGLWTTGGLGDFVSSAPCYGMTSHHQQSYSQSYGPTSNYYSNMDYLNPTPINLPVSN